VTDPRKFLTRFQPASSLRASHLVATDSLKLTAACPTSVILSIYFSLLCTSRTTVFPRRDVPDEVLLIPRVLYSATVLVSVREKILLIERRSLVSKRRFQLDASSAAVGVYLHFFYFYIPCIMPFAKRSARTSNKPGALVASWRNTSVVMNH